MQMDGRWRIEMLGVLRAVRGDRVLTHFRTQKTGALLAYLAYYSQRSHLRDALIELFWPDGDLAAGRNNLSRELSWLRQHLEPPSVPPGTLIIADRAAIRLNSEAVATDVAAFEAALQAAEHADIPAERARHLAEAIEAYGSELLPGYYDGWVLQEREWLTDRYFQALRQLLTHMEQARELARALEYARRGVRADPLREEAHRDLMRLLAATGQPAAALRQYRELKRLLKQGLDATPAEEIRALARDIEAQTETTPRPPGDRARARGEHPIEGKAEAGAAYEVHRPGRSRSRVDVPAERGLSPFVGRDAALETLLDRYHAARSGRGGVVLVRGEAGIGKSRLLFEFRRSLNQESLTWLEGRCISFGREIAYLPILGLLKDLLGIEDTETEAAIIARVEAAVQPLGTALRDMGPFLRHLLAVDPGEPSVATMDPMVRKVRVREALRDLLLATAQARPLVIAVEDLHWIDAISAEFLVNLAPSLTEYPILLLLTSRPGHERHFSDLSDVTLLELHPLSERDSTAVAQGVLEATELPAEMRGLILSKAEGNPFFVEEITRSLVEAGALRRAGAGYVLARRLEEIHVPDTVQDVILARLDRLPEEPKRAIQTAAVIGCEFTVRLLEHTAQLQEGIEQYLNELQAVELIYPSDLSPELAYMFKHALTHDVAYHSLLGSRRKVLHRLVGAAIEALYRERLAEQYETLAYHYERAEVWDKALEYLQKSGEKELAAFAPQQAVTFYDRALALLEKPGQTLAPERMMALHSGRGQALFQTSEWDRSVMSFQAMREAALGAGDPIREGVALASTANVNLFAHHFDHARDDAERARSLAVSTNDRTTLAGSWFTLGMVAGVTGNLKNSRSAIGEALALSRQGGAPDQEASARFFASHLDCWRGDYTGALEHLDDAVRIGREHQLSFWLLGILWSKGLAHCGRGEYEEALRRMTEGLDLSARLGEKFC